MAGVCKDDVDAMSVCVHDEMELFDGDNELDTRVDVRGNYNAEVLVNVLQSLGLEAEFLTQFTGASVEGMHAVITGCGAHWQAAVLEGGQWYFYERNHRGSISNVGQYLRVRVGRRGAAFRIDKREQVDDMLAIMERGVRERDIVFAEDGANQVGVSRDVALLCDSAGAESAKEECVEGSSQAARYGALMELIDVDEGVEEEDDEVELRSSKSRRIEICVGSWLEHMYGSTMMEKGMSTSGKVYYRCRFCKEYQGSGGNPQRSVMRHQAGCKAVVVDEEEVSGDLWASEVKE